MCDSAALVAERLQILDAEHVAFSLKSVWSDGTYQIILSPEELLEKLAALVPPPLLTQFRALPRRAGPPLELEIRGRSRTSPAHSRQARAPRCRCAHDRPLRFQGSPLDALA